MRKKFLQFLPAWLTACLSWQAFTALGVLGLIAYVNAIVHPFVHDDIHFLVENPSLRNFNLWTAFIHPLDMGIASAGINLYYRPLLDLVNHGQYLMFGLNPHGFHFFNVCLHILNSFLVYAVVLRILGEHGISMRARTRFAAFLTAAIFLVHPVQTQAVACVSGISNLLFVFLCLSAFLLYIESRRKVSNQKSMVLYVLALALFACAIFAKEQALVFPLLIVWFDLCFSGSRPRAAGWPTAFQTGGWFVVVAAYVLFKKCLVGSQPLLDAHFFNQELWLRVTHIPQILLTNLSLIVFPKDLHYFRSVDILDPVLPSVIVFLSLMILALLAYRRMSVPGRRMTLFGAGWFVLTQALTINVLPLIWEYSYISTAEHFLYLPMIGIVLPCVCALTQRKRFGAGMIFVVGASVIALLTVLTIRQNSYWKSETGLFERAARFEANVGRVQMLLGKAYYSAGQFFQANEAFERAHNRMQYYERAAFGEQSKMFYRGLLKDIAHDWARSHQAMGDFPTAEKYFLEALAWSPEDAVVHNDLGVLYTVMQKNDLALIHFRKAFEQDSNNEIFIKNTVMALGVTGQKPQALELIHQVSGRPGAPDVSGLLKEIKQLP